MNPRKMLRMFRGGHPRKMLCIFRGNGMSHPFARENVQAVVK